MGQHDVRRTHRFQSPPARPLRTPQLRLSPEWPAGLVRTKAGSGLILPDDRSATVIGRWLVDRGLNLIIRGSGLAAAGRANSVVSSKVVFGSLRFERSSERCVFFGGETKSSGVASAACSAAVSGPAHPARTQIPSPRFRRGGAALLDARRLAFGLAMRCCESDSPGSRPLPSHSSGASISVDGLNVPAGRAGAADLLPALEHRLPECRRILKATRPAKQREPARWSRVHA